ncbi:unnamed protein product [Hymenolepis diminuta]|uniref:Reverse transcriptase domain-containing protein n=1 Tax=Hymenolepis diminuta TaxID=6216 RepID=A0A0R3SUT8_HYMDI|nr:unnamed protein product [Hymenolepis diminuta]
MISGLVDPAAYLDDIIIVGNSEEELQGLVEELFKNIISSLGLKNYATEMVTYMRRGFREAKVDPEFGTATGSPRSKFVYSPRLATELRQSSPTFFCMALKKRSHISPYQKMKDFSHADDPPRPSDNHCIRNEDILVAVVSVERDVRHILVEPNRNTLLSAEAI